MPTWTRRRATPRWRYGADLFTKLRGFIPNIRQKQYSDAIVTFVAERHPALTKPDDLPVPEPNAGLPKTWDEIGPGHLVVAKETLEYGWWEAIVLRRVGDMLTLRFRDYPNPPKFVRHRSAVALVSTGLSKPPATAA